MKRKYNVLGIVAVIYQMVGLLAIFVGILAVVAAIYTSFIAQPRDPLTIAAFVPTGISLIITGIIAFAFGQLINLLRDLELNTRRTSAYMYQIAKRSSQRTQRRAARRTTTTTTVEPPNYARPIVDEDVVQRTTTTTIVEPGP